MTQDSIAQITSRISTVRSISSGQTPDLKGIGIQLLEALLIPVPVIITLAVIMFALFRWLKSRGAARKSEQSMLEEGQAQEALQIHRYTSPHFKRPDVTGRSSINAIPGVSVRDFALAPPPPTPNLPGADANVGVPRVDLGESAVMSGGVSAMDMTYRFSALPQTPRLCGVEGLDEIERLDLGESRSAK